jgi:hypothetical protein
MHGLITLFLEVNVLAIILLLVGFFVLVVLVFATREIMALMILMTIVRSSVIAIALVASMVLVILATMLPVSGITAARDGKMSRLLLFGLFLLLDLTLLEKGNEPKRGHGHHLVCLCRLKLMCLGLRKEDLFALLLHCGKLHRLTDVATVKVAEELYSMLHELMH